MNQFSKLELWKQQAKATRETMLHIGGIPNDLNHCTQAPYRGRRPYRGPIRETNRKNMYGRTQTCSHFKSVNAFLKTVKIVKFRMKQIKRNKMTFFSHLQVFLINLLKKLEKGLFWILVALRQSVEYRA